MTINSNWVIKDFKQKYFLYCRDSNFEVKKHSDSFGNLENKLYICKRIEIKEI